jgi:hypothetical protein
MRIATIYRRDSEDSTLIDWVMVSTGQTSTPVRIWMYFAVTKAYALQQDA